MVKPAGTTARGYGYDHQTLRRWWKPRVEQGWVDCARCEQPIQPGQPWDLGHNQDRTTWSGPEHQACNRSTTRKGMDYLSKPRATPRPRLRNCEHCGCEYRAKDTHQRYCSRPCANAARTRWNTPSPRTLPPTRNCIECGQPFPPTTAWHLVCSDTCASQRNNRLTSQRIMQRYHTDPEYRTKMIERAKERYRRLRSTTL